MVKLVDTQDLKSCAFNGRAGSIPAPGTKILIRLVPQKRSDDVLDTGAGIVLSALASYDGGTKIRRRSGTAHFLSAFAG